MEMMVVILNVETREKQCVIYCMHPINSNVFVTVKAFVEAELMKHEVTSSNLLVPLSLGPKKSLIKKQKKQKLAS
jgi:hypothetical protein